MASILVLQQLLTALNPQLNNAPPMLGNSTVNVTEPLRLDAVPSATPMSLPSFLNFILLSSGLRDWFRLALIGAAFELFRRISLSLYRTIFDHFFLTARFHEDDMSFCWMMFWLSQQPSWNKARDVEVSTSSFGLQGSSNIVPGEEVDVANALTNKRKMSFLPSVSTTYTMWYKSTWMRVTREESRTGYYGRTEETLVMCLFAWDHRVLCEILLEAKKEYFAAQENNISIWVSDTSNNWRLVASRPKRPLNSIVLDPGIKDMLIDDARDFLESKSWYAARGIPFRRGYLLYGAPGSGKTSIIHSLAGELGLDVYVISLSRAGLDDTALSALIAELPEKCIALMEDIDAAFTQTLNRDDDQREKSKPDSEPGPPKPTPTTSRISLSGLLNALDGVGAQEGRILFATTNKYTSLDSALCRPGRMDLHIEFKLASSFQAHELYRHFYLPDAEEPVETDVTEEGDSGYASEKDLITLDKEAESAPVTPSTPDRPDPPTIFTGNSHKTRAPTLNVREVNVLARKFASVIPERELSMASLQGYLMMYKVRPYEAVENAAAWVVKERMECLAREAEKASLQKWEKLKVEVENTKSESAQAKDDKAQGTEVKPEMKTGEVKQES